MAGDEPEMREMPDSVAMEDWERWLRAGMAARSALAGLCDVFYYWPGKSGPDRDRLYRVAEELVALCKRLAAARTEAGYDKHGKRIQKGG